MTLPEDVCDREEIKRLFYVLAESVTARLRDADVGKADTVHIVVRNEFMEDATFQKKVPPTALCGEVAGAAFELFCKQCAPGIKVHMLGVSVSGFDYHIEQLNLLNQTEFRKGRNYEKKERAENAVAKLRDKYGYSTVQRGIMSLRKRHGTNEWKKRCVFIGRKRSSPVELQFFSHGFLTFMKECK